MRLTIRLEPELYAVAKSLARAEDCSLSSAVNQLIRRALGGGLAGDGGKAKPATRNGLPVVTGRRPVTPEMVARAEAEDETA